MDKNGIFGEFNSCNQKYVYIVSELGYNSSSMLAS